MLVFEGVFHIHIHDDIVDVKIVRKVYNRWLKIAHVDYFLNPMVGPITRAQFLLECFLNKHGYLLDLADTDPCPN